MKTRRSVLVASLLVAGAFSSTLTGCGSTNSSATSIGHLRSSLTPELSTLAWRPAEVSNNLAIAQNQHFRALNEDIGRLLLYVDRPTRLTPAPVGY